jgi:hypothetical protein
VRFSNETWNRAYRWLSNVWRAGRKQPFDRKEQLSVVRMFHIVILGGVWAIVLASDMASSPPRFFIVFEISIILMCGLMSLENPPLKRFIARFIDSKKKETVTENQSRVYFENIQGKALLVAFALQFAALWPLLTETGGPIESPFAQMAVVFAIFTPFIANRWMTSISALVITIAYYAALLTIAHWEELEPPSVWVYFGVNVMILILAVALTLVDLLVRDRASGSGPNVV